MGFVFAAWLCFSASVDIVYRKAFNWVAIFGGVIAVVSISISPKLHPVDIVFFDSLCG